MFKNLISLGVLIFASSVSAWGMSPGQRCEANLLLIHAHYLSTVDKSQDRTEALERLAQFRLWELREVEPQPHTKALDFSSTEKLSAAQKIQLAGRIKGIELSSAQAEAEKSPETTVTTDIAVITGAQNIADYFLAENATMIELQKIAHPALAAYRNWNVIGGMIYYGLSHKAFHVSPGTFAVFTLAGILIAELDSQIYYQIQKKREKIRREKNEILSFMAQGSGWYYDAQNFVLSQQLVQQLQRRFLDPVVIGAQELWGIRSLLHRVFKRLNLPGVSIWVGLEKLPHFGEPSVWVGLDRYLDFNHEGQPRLTLIARTSLTRPQSMQKSDAKDAAPQGLPQTAQ